MFQQHAVAESNHVRRENAGWSSRPISIVRLRARYCANHSTSRPRPRSLSIAGMWGWWGKLRWRWRGALGGRDRPSARGI